MKRSKSPILVENPFIKAENKTWSLGGPPSLTARISPPRSREAKTKNKEVPEKTPSTAAVEAGIIGIEDPVTFFSAKLSHATLPQLPDVPRLLHAEWLGLYQRNQHAHGRHFVIHQHDHPVAGTHYDLRLQCNGSSSISWAIMYGLPGDPNSRRLNRNATETRVHNLWNHLIETASYSTGSMLVWDTGEYSVLPYRDENFLDSDTESVEADDFQPSSGHQRLSESEKLHQAFQQRKIRLQLHGTRLPQNYTLAIRISKDNFFTREQPKKPAQKRRRVDPKARARAPETSDSETSEAEKQVRPKKVQSLYRTASPPTKADADADIGHASSEESSETIRLTNAYTGASNDIGSVHQRKWYLSMDRQSTGFVPVRGSKGTGAKTWVRKRRPDGSLDGFEKFWVMGRDVERSVVTGRLAKDILKDEGVDHYVPRGLWRPVTE